MMWTAGRSALPMACAVLVLSAAMGGCIANEQSEGRAPLVTDEQPLTPEERRARALIIKEASLARGLTNAFLLAGIASAETGLIQCWSEATWACQGPNSPDCGGGPVIAGAGDGPCEDRQGGLGMFQFDAGTYEQTLEREGERILTVAGNVDAAIDFTLAMVVRSRYIDAVDDNAQALAWMNQVRVDNELFHPWIQTVTHYYNGCVPERCSVYDSRYAGYSSKTINIYEEFGEDFWYGEVPPCGVLGPDGGDIDESDPCFIAGGNSRFWRPESDGFGGTLLWTNATDSDNAANYALWQLFFEEPGQYIVEVYTDADFAESQQTRYQIVHAGQSSEVTIDQTATDGFQALGQFEFGTDIEQYIRFNDNTGEPNSTQTAIVADALRFTRVNNDANNDPGGNNDPEGNNDPGNNDPDGSNNDLDANNDPVIDDMMPGDMQEDPIDEFAQVRVRANACTQTPANAPGRLPLLLLFGLVSGLVVRTHRRAR